MRLPINENNRCAREIDASFEIVRKNHLSSLSPSLQLINANVMVGDGSVTQVATFEPFKVKNFYERLVKILGGWWTTGISESKTDDLHRLYSQFSKEARQYRISAYFGIQYHTLPYFKVDRQVIELHKKLNLVANEASTTFSPVAIKGDQIIQTELERIGYGNLNAEDLLIKLMEDKELADTLEEKVAVVESEFPKFQELSREKDRLYS